MAIFTISNGQRSVINRFDEGGTSSAEFDNDLLESTSEYTRPLIRVYGVRISHMHIDLAAVVLMGILVITSLIAHFKK